MDHSQGRPGVYPTSWVTIYTHELLTCLTILMTSWRFVPRVQMLFTMTLTEAGTTGAAELCSRKTLRTRRILKSVFSAMHKGPFVWTTRRIKNGALSSQCQPGHDPSLISVHEDTLNGSPHFNSSQSPSNLYCHPHKTPSSIHSLIIGGVQRC